MARSGTPCPPIPPGLEGAPLSGPGPKRILALDGGGLKGIATGCLEALEQRLRQQHGNDPDFCLSDYFDLISGTSTGASIAP